MELLCCYVAKRQRVCRVIVKPISYAHNTQTHCLTHKTTSGFIISWLPPESDLLPVKQAHDTDVFRETLIQAREKL